MTREAFRRPLHLSAEDIEFVNEDGITISGWMMDVKEFYAYVGLSGASWRKWKSAQRFKYDIDTDPRTGKEYVKLTDVHKMLGNMSYNTAYRIVPEVEDLMRKAGLLAED